MVRLLMSIQTNFTGLLGNVRKSVRGGSDSAFDSQKLLMSRWLWCAVVVLVISVRALVANAEQLFSGAGDTDDIMRLMQVRQFLEHGDWFDLTIAQVGAPVGSSLSSWLPSPPDPSTARATRPMPGASDTPRRTRRRTQSSSRTASITISS